MYSYFNYGLLYLWTNNYHSDNYNRSKQVFNHRNSCFTLTAVTILRQLQAGPTAPAGVGSWAV